MIHKNDCVSYFGFYDTQRGLCVIDAMQRVCVDSVRKIVSLRETFSLTKEQIAVREAQQ